MNSLVRQSVFVVPAVVQIAHRLRLFDDAGVDVATDLVSSSAAQRDDLLDGRCDLAITAIDNLFAWNAAGADLALIGQIEISTRLVLALRPGLTTLDGTRPVRLGVDAPDNGFAVVLRAFMAHRGIGADRYTLAQVGGVRERLAALEAGTVDATLLSPPLDALAVSRGMELTGPSLDDVAPGYPGLGIVAPRSVLVDRRAAVVGYLAAIGRALARSRAASDGEMAQWLSDEDRGVADVAVLRSSMPTSLMPGLRGLRVLADLRADLGMQPPGAPSPEDLVDVDVVTAAMSVDHR